MSIQKSHHTPALESNGGEFEVGPFEVRAPCKNIQPRHATTTTTTTTQGGLDTLHFNKIFHECMSTGRRPADRVFLKSWKSFTADAAEKHYAANPDDYIAVCNEHTDRIRIAENRVDKTNKQQKQKQKAYTH